MQDPRRKSHLTPTNVLADDGDGDQRIAQAIVHEGEQRMFAPMDRDRLSNDNLNTSVMAALIGGFACGFLTTPEEDAEDIDYAIYVLSCLSTF